MKIVRNMKRADAPRVAEIHVGAWKYAYKGIVPQRILDAMDVKEREERWRAIIDRSDARCNLVVEENGVVMGWGGYGLNRDDDKDATKEQEVYAVYVDHNAFRNGYGQDILDECLKRMLENDPEEITLWVLKDNIRARSFYEKNGFIPDGKTKAEEWLDNVVGVRMVKQISTFTVSH